MSEILHKIFSPFAFDYFVFNKTKSKEMHGHKILLSTMTGIGLLLIAGGFIVPLMSGIGVVAGISFGVRCASVVMLAFAMFRYSLEYLSNHTELLNQNFILRQNLEICKKYLKFLQNNLEVNKKLEINEMKDHLRKLILDSGLTDPRVESLLNDAEIPVPLRCSISLNLMEQPVKGLDNQYYDRLYLAAYYQTNPNAGYPLNPNIKIDKDPLLLPIDKTKYLEIQNYKQSFIFKDNQKSWMKSAKAASFNGVICLGIAFLLASPFGFWGLTAFISCLGFLGGIGMYFRDGYACMALESVRRQNEEQKNMSLPQVCEISQAYQFGISASKGYLSYFKSCVPLFKEGRIAYVKPKEWYAGLQAGFEENIKEDLIIYKLR